MRLKITATKINDTDQKRGELGKKEENKEKSPTSNQRVKLKVSQRCVQMAKAASSILAWISNGVASRSR